MSLDREQAEWVGFSRRAARRHSSGRDAGGSLELWGQTTFRTGLQILLTIVKKTNKQVLLKQPGGNVGEDLSARRFCNLVSLVYFPALLPLTLVKPLSCSAWGSPCLD